MTRPSGLGRGLSALLPAAAPGQSGLLNLRVTAVVPNPRQPRTLFDDEALIELAQSVRQVGILQPIVVRPAGENLFELVAGERRLRAARLAGLEEIPAIVRRTEDEDLLTEALVENLQRVDLNPIEEAQAYQQLLDDFGFTHDQLADRLGKSRSAISNILRLLQLSPTLQERVASGLLSAGHARALLGLADPEHRERVAQRIAAEDLSVRATEALVRKLVDGADAAADELAAAARRRRQSPYAGLQQRLSDALATRVVIKGTARRGRVVIDYAGVGDLERLLDIFGRGTGENLLAE